MSMEERVAVLEVKQDANTEMLKEIREDVKTLVNERYQGIGKKSVWAVIYGAVGAFIVTILNFIGNKA